MFAKFHLLFAWISSSACAIIRHQSELEQCPSRATQGAGNDNPLSWGSDLYLGFKTSNTREKSFDSHAPQRQLPNKDLCNNPPHFSTSNGDGTPAPNPLTKIRKEIDPKVLGVEQRNGVAAHGFGNDDPLSSSSELSLGLEPSDAHEKQLTNKDPLDNPLHFSSVNADWTLSPNPFSKKRKERVAGVLGVDHMNYKPLSPTSKTHPHFSSKNERTLAPNSLSKKRKMMDPIVIGADHLNSQTISRLFETHIEKYSQSLQTNSLYTFSEVLGLEIINEMKLIPKMSTYENSLQLASMRLCVESHSVKAIVSYLDVASRIFVPPLFENAEQLEEAQRSAVQSVETFWQKFNQKIKTLNEADPDVTPVVPLSTDEEKVDRLLIPKNYRSKQTNQICEVLFIIWMRENRKDVHEAMCADDSKREWKQSIIAALRKYLMSLKSNEEVLDAVQHVTKPKDFEKGKLLSYRLKRPFKIKWDIKKKVFL